jgi:hypothetical protein
VQTYRNAQSKDEKRAMEKLINQIKNDFESEIAVNDKRLMKLNKLKGELIALTTQTSLFEQTAKEKAAWNKQVGKLTQEINALEQEIEEIKSNKIYDNAFEWRFEFPEVLNDDGGFVGFDVVIGNPPYVYRNADIEPLKSYFNLCFFNNTGNYDLYKYFIEMSVSLLKDKAIHSFITNSSFLLQTSFEKTREFLLKNTSILILAPLGPNVFEEATVDSAIYIIRKGSDVNNKVNINASKEPANISFTEPYQIQQQRFLKNDSYVLDYLLNDSGYSLVSKLFKNFPKIETGFEFGVGINTGYIKAELTSNERIDDRYHPMVSGSGISSYCVPRTEGFIMYDKGFVKSMGERGRTLPDQRFFHEPKILVVRTRNLTLKRRIIATIDIEKCYNLNRLSNIIARENNRIEGLLGVLNSSLFNWLYSVRFYDYEIKPIYLRNSPMCDINDARLVKIVRTILDLKRTDPMLDTLELESQVDCLVYELYGLTSDEIRIVEGK